MADPFTIIRRTRTEEQSLIVRINGVKVRLMLEMAHEGTAYLRCEVPEGAEVSREEIDRVRHPEEYEPWAMKPVENGAA